MTKDAPAIYARQFSVQELNEMTAFYRTPTGAEMAGPCFTPDDKTLFLSVQHPAADDSGSTFERPSTRWPDFKDDMPPRPSVIAITHLAGEDIGS
jgi:hypothetical protein